MTIPTRNPRNSPAVGDKLLVNGTKCEVISVEGPTIILIVRGCEVPTTLEAFRIWAESALILDRLDLPTGCPVGTDPHSLKDAP